MLKDRETAVLEAVPDCDIEYAVQLMEKGEYQKHNPILCGLLIQQYLAAIHGWGVLHAGHGRILILCHMYNTKTQSEYLKAGTRWADIDYLIEKQGESYMFVGDRPTTMFKCSVQLRLACGISLSTLWREKAAVIDHRLQVQVPSRDPRYLKIFSALDQEFERRNGEFERAAFDPICMMERLIINHMQETRKKRYTRLQHQEKGLTPLQTLSVFKKAMKADEFAVRFDVSTLNTVCIQLMRAIQSHYQVHQSHRGDMMFTQTAMDLITNSSKRDDPKLSKVWSLVQEVIDNIGNHSYLNAGGNHNILHLARDPNWEKQHISMEELLAGLDSPKHPEDCYSTHSVNAMQLLVATPDITGEEEGSACAARKIFLQKLKRVTLTGGPIKSIAGLP